MSQQNNTSELGRKLPTESQKSRPLAKYQFPEFTCPRRERIAFAAVHLTALALFLSLLPFAPLTAVLVLAAGMSVFCGWVWHLARRCARGMRLHLFPSGLLLLQRNGVTHNLPWDRIEVRPLPPRHGQQAGFSLAREGGAVVCTLPADLPWANEAGTMIQQFSSRHLIRRRMQELQDGKAAAFGSLSVSLAGLGQGKRTLPWEMLEGWTQDQDKLTILCRGKGKPWAVVRLAQTPNVAVFYYLCEQCRPHVTQAFIATTSRGRLSLCL